MEELLLRFPDIGEVIFDLLDEESLQNCREVCRTWKNFIEDPNQKFLWIHIITSYEKYSFLKNYISDTHMSGQQKWKELRIQELRKIANSLNFSMDLDVIFLEQYVKMNLNLDARDLNGGTVFHWAIKISHPDLVDLLLKKSVDLNVDINAYDHFGYTGFHIACLGIYRIQNLEVILNNADLVNIDFGAISHDGGQFTGFEYAEMANLVDVTNLIRTKLPIGRY